MASVISALLEKLRAQADLQKEFENLKKGSFEITSEWTAVYNCIAFAAGEVHRKWWPVPLKYARKDVYWPKKVPPKESVQSFVKAFQTLRYELCENGNLEEGFEKVAVYAKGKNSPTHAARQLPNGRWTSKLGSKEDISHDTLHGVEGKIYGTVRRYMRRPLKAEVKIDEETT